jgi:hypothetical protein
LRFTVYNGRSQVQVPDYYNFSDYSFRVHHPVNQNDWYLHALAMASDRSKEFKNHCTKIMTVLLPTHIVEFSMAGWVLLCSLKLDSRIDFEIESRKEMELVK